MLKSNPLSCRNEQFLTPVTSNRSERSKQQATGLRAASVGAKRVPPGLSTPRIACALAAFAAFV